ncbi:hypothetical protein JD292_10690 [Leucobacter sp. CSA2]|uniref:Uncharacterized protein n=1 Tax=Leucobacter edaphi TaxID=2796472 RepID=A0A934UYP5_9MICO|nr:hypothetical protein [Leucobacter edaphi]MBK0422537.1 hypothetical protein [Leucobacter edaphi]
MSTSRDDAPAPGPRARVMCAVSLSAPDFFHARISEEELPPTRSAEPTALAGSASGGRARSHQLFRVGAFAGLARVAGRAGRDWEGR